MIDSLEARVVFTQRVLDLGFTAEQCRGPKIVSTIDAEASTTFGWDMVEESPGRDIVDGEYYPITIQRVSKEEWRVRCTTNPYISGPLRSQVQLRSLFDTGWFRAPRSKVQDEGVPADPQVSAKTPMLKLKATRRSKEECEADWHARVGVLSIGTSVILVAAGPMHNSVQYPEESLRDVHCNVCSKIGSFTPDTAPPPTPPPARRASAHASTRASTCASSATTLL